MLTTARKIKTLPSKLEMTHIAPMRYRKLAEGAI
jgi:hypothetical protein